MLAVAAGRGLFALLGPDPVPLKGGATAGAMSLVGPLAAVAFVLVLRRPALGLFLAVVAGSIALPGPVTGAIAAAPDVFWPTVSDTDNLLILVFTASMLGMVHVAMAGGGFTDLALRIARGAGDHPDAPARRTRLATWALGLAIFFDDYANSLVVGSSMRPLADRTGVSRAKLAYLVDATSAAVAGVAIVSTWVGFEVGLLDDQKASFEAVAQGGYGIFLALIPYRFYCLLTIVFAFMVALSGRDFGPMRRAEAEASARATRDAGEDAGRAHWLDAMLPVLVVLFGVIGLDIALGAQALGDKSGTPLELFLAGADAAGLKVLAIAGGLGALTAIVGGVIRRLLTPGQALRAFAHGLVVTAPVLAILVCAMAMRAVCDASGTPGYLAAMLADVSGFWMPVTSFAVAALVAFMTGSSWATMGILLPIVVPLAAVDPGPGAIWLLAAAAAVLDGAIFGDHCSPISDTTVMSSAASGCPHDEHVLTQLPYALAVMVAAAGFGYVGISATALPPWTAIVAGTIALAAGLWTLAHKPGRPTDATSTGAAGHAAADD